MKTPTRTLSISKLTLALIAATLLGGLTATSAQADPYYHGRYHERYYGERPWHGRHWDPVRRIYIEPYPPGYYAPPPVYVPPPVYYAPPQPAGISIVVPINLR